MLKGKSQLENESGALHDRVPKGILGNKQEAARCHSALVSTKEDTKESLTPKLIL